MRSECGSGFCRDWVFGAVLECWNFIFSHFLMIREIGRAALGKDKGRIGRKEGNGDSTARHHSQIIVADLISFLFKTKLNTFFANIYTNATCWAKQKGKSNQIGIRSSGSSGISDPLSPRRAKNNSNLLNASKYFRQILTG